MIDWDRIDDEPPKRLARLAAGGGGGGGHESTSAKGTSEKLERLKAALAATQADPDLAANLLAGARAGLAKAADGVALTLRERSGLEAVVLTDGTRPSLTVADGFVDTFAPEASDWAFGLRQHEETIRDVIASVGRINVPVWPKFAGTGFAIAPGLVATNRHVLEAIAGKADTGWVLRWPDATTIDFVAEDGSETLATARVVDVGFTGPNAINDKIHFPNLDLAILRVEPIAAAAFPRTLPLDRRRGRLDADRALFVVGFPGRPAKWTKDGTPAARHETAAIMHSVFGGTFGVKKLAPGRVECAPGTLPGDPERWVFSHDASTLGGNSGSAVVDFYSGVARVAGIHFGGHARDENYAHSFAPLADVMEAQGATYLD